MQKNTKLTTKMSIWKFEEKTEKDRRNQLSTSRKNGKNKNRLKCSKLYLDKKVNDAHWQDNDKKHRSAVADYGYGSHYAKCTHDPRVQTTWQLRVDDVNVFRKTVHDATDRRAVEKRHRRPESALQDRSVQQCCRVQHSLSKSKRRKQHSESCHRNTNTVMTPVTVKAVST